MRKSTYILVLSLLICTFPKLYSQALYNDCLSAFSLEVPSNISFETIDADTDGSAHTDNNACFGFGNEQIHNDIWYSIITSESGYFTISTCGIASFDTRLAIYIDDGNCPPTVDNLIACSDDGPACLDFTSWVLTYLEADQRYLIRVGAYGANETGVGTLNISSFEEAVPENDDCDTAINLEISESLGETTVIGTTTNGSFNINDVQISNCDEQGFGDFSDVWYSFQSDGTDEFIVLEFNELSPGTFNIDLYLDCDSAVPSDENYNSCFRTTTSDTTVLIGPLFSATDYLIRVSTNLAYGTAADFQIELSRDTSFLVQENPCLVDSELIVPFEYDDRDYYIVKNSLNWIQAATCANEGNLQLLEINDEAEQAAVEQALANSGIGNTESAPFGIDGTFLWIGAYDYLEEGYWFWDGNNDGFGQLFWKGDENGSIENEAYVNWGLAPDDFMGEDGLAIAVFDWSDGTSGQWNDLELETDLYYIMETPEVVSTSNLDHESITVSPRVNNGYFNIDTPDSNVKVKIFDYSGKPIDEQLLAIGRNEIEMLDVPSGLYILYFESPTNQWSEKVLILK